MKYILAIILSIFISIPAHALMAPKLPPVSSNKCMKENIRININYRLSGSGFAEVKKKIDAQTAKIAEYAKQQKLDNLELKSKNYNINTSVSNYNQDGTPQNFSFKGNGSISYTLNDADKASKFSEFLISQKLQVSMNSNMRRQRNCIK